MKFIKTFALMILLIGTFSTSAFAASPAETAFDKLKSLAGIWTLTGDETGQITYEVKAAGSALIENSAGMVTVFHLDGDSLLLTHYCEAGNQPRLRAVDFSDPSSLRFDFADLTNSKPGVGHINGLTLTWQDNDHVTARWSYLEKSGEVKAVQFTMVRQNK